MNSEILCVAEASGVLSTEFASPLRSRRFVASPWLSDQQKGHRVTDYSSFILKIRIDERRNVLVGSIEHAATKESLRFREMGRMMQFIFAHLPPASNPMIPTAAAGPADDGQR